MDSEDEQMEAWRRVLAADPMREDALVELERLAEASERWQELVLVLTRRAELSMDRASAAAMWRRAASVLREQLGDAAAADDAVRRAAELTRA